MFTWNNCFFQEQSFSADSILSHLKMWLNSAKGKRQPLGAVLYKICSGVFFSFGIGELLDSTTSAEKNLFCGGRLGKLGVLLKIYLFAWDIEVFWILIDRSSYRRCSVRKGVLRNFTKFTGKDLCQSLFF